MVYNQRRRYIKCFRLPSFCMSRAYIYMYAVVHIAVRIARVAHLCGESTVESNEQYIYEMEWVSLYEPYKREEWSYMARQRIVCRAISRARIKYYIDKFNIGNNIKFIIISVVCHVYIEDISACTLYTVEYIADIPIKPSCPRFLMDIIIINQPKWISRGWSDDKHRKYMPLYISN